MMAKIKMTGKIVLKELIIGELGELDSALKKEVKQKLTKMISHL